jgi:hypothetical protein
MRQSMMNTEQERSERRQAWVKEGEGRAKRIRKRNFIIMISALIAMAGLRYMGKLTFKGEAIQGQSSLVAVAEAARKENERIALAMIAAGDQTKAEVLAQSAKPETVWVPAAAELAGQPVHPIRVRLIGHGEYQGPGLVLDRTAEYATVLTRLDSLKVYRDCSFSLNTSGALFARCGGKEIAIAKR